jgi:DNA polymerase
MDVPNQDSLAVLAWLIEAGADEAVGEEALNRLAALAVPAPQRTPGGVVPTFEKAGATKHQEESNFAGERLRAHRVRDDSPRFHRTVASPANDHAGRATEIAAGCKTLAELKAALDAFDGCTLKRHAQNTVFADGTPDRRIVFIGEAPGRDEDRAGLPFVGRAGKLLDKMLAAIDLDRRKNVYITNVLNWRPPENRDPTPEEAASCLPFLRRHIELAAPKIIVLLGTVSARYVMGKSDGIMRLRGKWLEYFVGGRIIPVMPTLHPAYLLRRPVDKKLAWRDLQAIASKVEALGLLEQGSTRG